MRHGVEDLEDEIVDRIDVPPGFAAGSALASIVLRWMPFDQKSAPPSSTMTRVGRSGRKAGCCAATARSSPIRIRRYSAAILLPKNHCNWRSARVDRNSASAPASRTSKTGSWQSPRSPGTAPYDQFTTTRQCQAAAYLLSLYLALGFQMGDPDGAITCADANRAVAPGQNLAGCTSEAILHAPSSQRQELFASSLTRTPGRRCCCATSG